MADFLSSFNFNTEARAPSSDKEIGSVDDLQSRLQTTLQSKTTPTRAEHVSQAFELRGTVRFTIGLSDGESRALEGLDTVDPSLGGLSSNGAVTDDATGQTTRVITANETLMNQTDNPILQRAVAKHIIGVVGAADGSTWMLRDLSRGAQGWIFTYICKDSHQHWSRQNSKNLVKTIVGEYTSREPDATLMGKFEQWLLGPTLCLMLTGYAN